MSCYISICFLCKFFPLGLQINSGQLPSSLHPNHTTELEDPHKFSLDTLTTLLGAFALSGFEALQPGILTLFIYTISLHLAINTCFLHNYPTLSKFLHVVPLLGTSGMAGVVLVLVLESPGLAALLIFLGTLPLFAIAIYRGIRCGEISGAGLPMQTRMQDVQASAMQGVAASVAETPPASG